MHQSVPFSGIKFKIFWGCPLPRPNSLWGGGDPLPTPYPVDAFGVSPSMLSASRPPALKTDQRDCCI